MKNKYLEKAMKIVNENEVFYFKDEIIDGVPYRIFNYKLASYEDFNKDKFALELRGLTINLETGEYYLGLHKFFNDNENSFTMDDTNWNGKLECREKLDGSLIQCIVNNNKIYLKTKGTFNSNQVKEAQKLLNKNYKNFILDMNKNGYFVFFEYISPFNQIVVEYPDSELRLIQIRNKNGNYLDYNQLKELAEKYNIPYVKVEYYTLQELRKLQEEKEGIEGWVVRNKKEPLERQFRKFKTKWYFLRHHLIGPDNLAENKLIEHIINETIDDVISQLPQEEKRNKIEEIRKKVSHYFDRTYSELLKLLEEKNNSNRKEFALKYKDLPYFGVLMKAKNENELEKLLKEKIIKDTSKLSKAREFLKVI